MTFTVNLSFFPFMALKMIVIMRKKTAFLYSEKYRLALILTSLRLNKERHNITKCNVYLVF